MTPWGKCHYVVGTSWCQPARDLVPTGLGCEILFMQTRTLLRIALQAAVPICKAQLRDASPKTLEFIAHESGRILGEKGDALQFGGTSAPSRRATAEAFDALARGIACAELLGLDADRMWGLIEPGSDAV